MQEQGIGKEVKKRRRGICIEAGIESKVAQREGKAGEERRENRVGVRGRVEGIKRKGKRVIRVGTGSKRGVRVAGIKSKRKQEGYKRSKRSKGKGQERREEERNSKEEKGKKRKGKVVRVEPVWVSGRLTNNREYVKYVKRYREKQKGKVRETTKYEKRQERWYKKNRRGREDWLRTEAERPGVVVFRNPEEQEAGRKEASRCGVPTVGRITEDRKPEREQRRTYGRKWPKGDRGKVMRGERRWKRRHTEVKSEKGESKGVRKGSKEKK